MNFESWYNHSAFIFSDFQFVGTENWNLSLLLFRQKSPKAPCDYMDRAIVIMCFFSLWIFFWYTTHCWSPLDFWNLCNISTSGSRGRTITTPTSNLLLVEVARWASNWHSDQKCRKRQNSTNKQTVKLSRFSRNKKSSVLISTSNA